MNKNKLNTIQTNSDDITLNSEPEVIFQGIGKRLLVLALMAVYIILYFKIPNQIQNKISDLDININVDGNPFAIILLLLYLLGSLVYLFFYLFNYRKTKITKTQTIFFLLYLLSYILFLTIFSYKKQYISLMVVFFLSSYRPILFLPLLLSTLVIFGRNKYFSKLLIFTFLFPSVIGLLDLIFYI